MKRKASPNAKLTPADVREIRGARGRRSQRDLARQYGVTAPTISDIQRGKTWASLPAGDPMDPFTEEGAAALELELGRLLGAGAP